MATDILFYMSCAWLILLCIMRYFRITLWISALCATLVSLSVGMIAFLILNHINSKKILSKRERETCAALLLHLALEKPERVRMALLTAYQADGRNVHCEGESLNVDGIYVLPIFTMEPLSADMVAHTIRDYGAQKLTILCKALSAEAEKLLATFSIKAATEKEVYELFTRTNTMPNPFICGEKPKRTIRSKLKRTFSKKNAHPFFVSGSLLLIMSLFTFFPTYYIITGSILLGCALFVRFFGVAV